MAEPGQEEDWGMRRCAGANKFSEIDLFYELDL
jgi:hypothetical protein